MCVCCKTLEVSRIELEKFCANTGRMPWQRTVRAPPIHPTLVVAANAHLLMFTNPATLCRVHVSSHVPFICYYVVCANCIPQYRPAEVHIIITFLFAIVIIYVKFLARLIVSCQVNVYAFYSTVLAHYTLATQYCTLRRQKVIF